MGSLLSSYLAVELPPDFPSDAYDRVATLIESSGLDALGRTHARGGWLGLGFRYLSVATADEAFRRSLDEQVPVFTNAAERSKQETALFLFFTAACSVVECLSYAAYASAAGTGSPRFRIGTSKQRRDVKPGITLDAFRSAYPDAALVTVLGDALASETWAQLAATRNVLIHQAVPVRQLYLDADQRTIRSASIRQSDHDGSDIAIEPDLTAVRRRWLGGTITALVGSLEEWFESRT